MQIRRGLNDELQCYSQWCLLADVYLHELICMEERGGEPVGWRKNKETERRNSTCLLLQLSHRNLHLNLREKGCMQSLKEVFLKDTWKISTYRLWCFWSRDDTGWKHLEVSHIWHGYQSHHAWYWCRYWARPVNGFSGYSLRLQRRPAARTWENCEHIGPQLGDSGGHIGWGQKIYIMQVERRPSKT